MEKLKKFIVVEYFESWEPTIVMAKNEKEAIAKIFDDEEHNGEIVDCYEEKK